MNLADLTQFVCTKGQMVGSADITAAKLFLAKRYELIWNSYLWKDSLVMVDVSVSPDDANNAAGIVLMPEIIDRVVAIRTGDRSVKVNGLETFYREDFDKFAEQGTPYEFAILSPVWFIWRHVLGLKLVSTDPSDDGKQIRVTRVDSQGRRFVETVTLNAANPPTWGATSSTGNLVNIGTALSAGPFIWDGIKWGDGGVTYVWPIPNAPYRPAVNVVGDLLGNGYTSPTLLGRYPNPNPIYAAYYARIAYAGSGDPITIESVFKPATTGTVQFREINSSEDPAGELAPTVTGSPKYQRIRLFYIPQVQTTLKVLGKRKCSALTFDQEEPEIRNLDNCLIAFALGDLWARRRQMAKANQFYQEGTALLKELAKLETMQAAHNSRFIPDAGAGDPFFGPGRSAGFWI